MINFEPVVPIGSRTCCNLSGKPKTQNHIWLDDQVAEHADELAAAKSGRLDHLLTRAQHMDAVGVLESLKRKASQGELKVGSGPEYRARRIRRVDYLLELRPKFGKGKPPPRLLRLYYAEPKQVEGSLLPLVLATKENSADTDEQNKSLDDAKVRSRRWTMMRGFPE